MSEWEGIVTITNAAAQQPHGVDTWTIARRAALHNQPFWTTWADSMTKVAEDLAPEQIREAARIVEVSLNHPHGVGQQYGHLGAGFWAAVAKLMFPKSIGASRPRMKCAVIVAHTLSPPSEIDESGKCSLMKPANITPRGTFQLK